MNAQLQLKVYNAHKKKNELKSKLNIFLLYFKTFLFVCFPTSLAQI
jgi:hypothetical protein